jgi:hypothetical protein
MYWFDISTYGLLPCIITNRLVLRAHSSVLNINASGHVHIHEGTVNRQDTDNKTVEARDKSQDNTPTQEGMRQAQTKDPPKRMVGHEKLKFLLSFLYIFYIY